MNIYFSYPPEQHDAVIAVQDARMRQHGLERVDCDTCGCPMYLRLVTVLRCMENGRVYCPDCRQEGQTAE